MVSDLDSLARGFAVGAFAVVALGVWRSGLRGDARWATLLVCLSAAAWTLTESERTAAALGGSQVLAVLAFPVAALFCLFAGVVFDDRRVTPLRLAPAALFIGLGLALGVVSGAARERLGIVFNGAAALFCLHAALVILRGWRGDLVESRRSMRAVILGFAALFAAAQGVMAVLLAFDPGGPWRVFSVQQVYAAAIVALLALAMGGLFLEGRAPLFAAARPAAPTEDARLAAANAILLAKLDALMDQGRWREMNLTVGGLAAELGAPEHQLRRLINAGLGHRNFAEFLNAYRVRAAQARLGDPQDARTTIAAIAFDVGYGSLSPFNRAFRDATGQTPKAWRQGALAGLKQAE